MTSDVSRFGQRVLATVLIVGLIAATAYAIDLILLVFAGILLAVLLRGAGTWITEHFGLSRRWSMLIAVIGFSALFFGSLWTFGVQIANQADQLIAAVSQAYGELQQKLQQYRVADFLFSGGLGWGGPAKAASGLLSIAASIVLVLFLGMYLSTSPELYLDLFLSFFNAQHRARIAKLLDAMGSALSWWLLGQFIAMGVVGTITLVGLLVVGAPMPVSLSALAALMTFVPYVGAIAASVPAIMLGFTANTHMGFSVILVYLIAHVVEGYIISPMVQHRLVYLPPALILATQFLMELFAGIIGVMLATPLMVVSMVLIKELYFEQKWTEEVTDAA